MKEISRKKISNCRICNSNDFRRIIHLERMPLTDEFVTKDQIGKEFLADIEIAACQTCGSAQNMYDTDMGEYYSEYTYSVQSSGFAISFMRTLAGRMKANYFKEKEHPNVIEIGSGTGEQLLEFKKIGFDVLGVEPSPRLADYAHTIGVKTLTAFFDENTKGFVEPAFRKADAVITSYTFDHIPRPVEVLSNIHNILNDDGILLIEVHNLELIRQRNEFCLFEHEHYTYLNEVTMTSLLEKNKFEVLTYRLLSEKEKRANSLLVVARKSNSSKQSSIDVRAEVKKLEELDSEIKQSIARIENWLEANKDLKIVAYGAGGRGVMTIAAIKNSNRIRFIVDKNPKSPDIYAPKSHLPVYGIAELDRNRADKILVFSFGYYNEIVSELGSKYGYTPEQFISILDLLELNHA